MTIIIIVLSVLVAILLLLIVNIKLSVSYSLNDGNKVYLNFLFLKVKLYPKSRKGKSDKALDENSSEKNAPSKAEEAIKENAKSLISNFSKVGKIISATRFRLTITDLSIKLEVGLGDAAQTAVICGYLYTAAYGAIGLLQNVIYVDKPQIEIKPIYNKTTLNGEYNLAVKTKILNIIIMAIKILRIIKER